VPDMEIVFKKPEAMTDIPFPYCPGAPRHDPPSGGGGHG